jgi:hypothetical protein
MAARGQTKTKEFRKLVKEIRSLPTVEVNDPNYVRIKYLRYADDVRHLTHNQILLAEKGGSEEKTFGSSHLPGGES